MFGTLISKHFFMNDVHKSAIIFYIVLFLRLLLMVNLSFILWTDKFEQIGLSLHLLFMVGRTMIYDT